MEILFLLSYQDERVKVAEKEFDNHLEDPIKIIFPVE